MTEEEPKPSPEEMDRIYAHGQHQKKRVDRLAGYETLPDGISSRIVSRQEASDRLDAQQASPEDVLPVPIEDMTEEEYTDYLRQLEIHEVGNTGIRLKPDPELMLDKERVGDMWGRALSEIEEAKQEGSISSAENETDIFRFATAFINMEIIRRARDVEKRHGWSDERMKNLHL